MGEETQTYLDNTGQNHYNYFAKMVFVCAPRNFAGAKERNDLNMANMKKEYKMSAERKEELQKELTYLKTVREKEVADLIKEARGFGDLSENFEYKAAKQFKNQNESRIRYLEKMIKTAVVISDESKDDEVGMFNTVDVYFEDDDETETYKIVTTVRGNSLKNLISKESPLGAAIFGHKVGDRCEVKVNDDYSYFVKIMKIQNTVDDGSDDLRKF